MKPSNNVALRVDFLADGLSRLTASQVKTWLALASRPPGFELRLSEIAGRSRNRRAIRLDIEALQREGFLVELPDGKWKLVTAGEFAKAEKHGDPDAPPVRQPAKVTKYLPVETVTGLLMNIPAPNLRLLLHLLYYGRVCCAPPSKIGSCLGMSPRVVARGLKLLAAQGFIHKLTSSAEDLALVASAGVSKALDKFDYPVYRVGPWFMDGTYSDKAARAASVAAALRLAEEQALLLGAGLLPTVQQPKKGSVRVLDLDIPEPSFFKAGVEDIYQQARGSTFKRAKVTTTSRFETRRDVARVTGAYLRLQLETALASNPEFASALIAENSDWLVDLTSKYAPRGPLAGQNKAGPR